jgi:hypothetical protein
MGLQRMGGSPLTGATQANLTDTMEGRYLDPESNPWLSKTYGMAADDMTRAYRDATRGTMSQFAGAGRTTGIPGAYSAMQGRNMDILGENLRDLGTQIYGGAYDAERGRQMSAAGMTPAVSGMDWQDIQQGYGMGSQLQNQRQKELLELSDRFNFAQQEPRQRLQEYIQNLGAGQNSPYTQTSTPSQGVGAAEGIGMATSLLGLVAML